MNINRNNYETYFLLYLDRELGPAEMEAVEKFLTENTDLQKEYSLLRQTIQVPADIIFEQKDSLFRREEKRRIIPLYWVRIAAAVAILVTGSFIVTHQVLTYRAAGKKEISGETMQAGLKKDASNVNQGMGNGNTVQTNELALAVVSKKTKSVQLKKTVHQNVHANTAVQKIPVETLKQNQELPYSASASGPAETGLARQKPNDALPLQSAGMQAGKRPEPIVVRPVTDAAALLLLTSVKEEQARNAVAVLHDSEFQTDNAISVVALNDKNKNITGFFKKLTRRSPGDEETRKLRVSVFKISL
jgi:hypothetical protein